MRIFGIFLFLYLLNMSMNMLLDVLTRMPLNQSLDNLLHPFGVKVGTGVLTLLILLVIWGMNEVSFYIQEEMKKKK
ncbi:hypothetical protein [Ectobacillus polymachus]|uniref:hypothetical protein n=1 Tax=Ectobacillus polymachus TaxID=1508806 RepID=UPI003A892DEE